MNGVIRDERPALKISKKGEMKKSLAIFNQVAREVGFDSSSIKSDQHYHENFTNSGYGSYRTNGKDKYGDSFTLSFYETANTAVSIDELLGEKGYIESVFCSHEKEKCKFLKKEGMGITASGPPDKPVSSAQALLMPNGDLEIIVYSQRPGFYKSEIEKLCNSLNEKLKAYGTKAEMV